MRERRIVMNDVFVVTGSLASESFVVSAFSTYEKAIYFATGMNEEDDLYTYSVKEMVVDEDDNS